MHLVIFSFAFVYGVCFGEGVNTASSGHKVYGLQGGENAVGNLVFSYEISFGIAPLVISGVGAAIGTGLAVLLRSFRRDRLDPDDS